jgi:hypothetical protein
MAWDIAGQMHELCRCKFLCPCWFGPAEPDQGWCSGALIFDVERGDADGVDLGGHTVVLLADWPGDFWAGNGTARLYLDDRATPEQRQALEAIFSGKQGGPMEPVSAAVISKWLPAQTAAIAVNWGDTTTGSVGAIGKITSQRMKNQAGQPATVQGAAAMAAFQLERLEVARTAGSHWADPDLRHWDADSGTTGPFSWSA